MVVSGSGMEDWMKKVGNVGIREECLFGESESFQVASQSFG